ncbi:hypothetical protein CCH79_00011243 [Gambusia affinis]|uniref:Uncharacterized protein n=1 Tax=Gambusia affinis TaxID=33528 RepID=A0A315V1V4_GAMAF|nr:hypothetical protein CCH79_00011243 [Gambusia affinis]
MGDASGCLSQKAEKQSLSRTKSAIKTVGAVASSQSFQYRWLRRRCSSFTNYGLHGGKMIHQVIDSCVCENDCTKMEAVSTQNR